MTHLKNKNDFEKKSKIAKKLGKIALWMQEVIKSCIYGFIAFCVCLFIIGNTSISVFLGAFTVYLIIAKKVTEISKNINFIFDFCGYNLKLAITMIIVSIVGMFFFPSIAIITWPLMITGIILSIGATLGVKGVSMHKYYEKS